MITQSVASLEYIPAEIKPNIANQAYNPTGDVVEFGFVPAGTAGAPSAWYAGVWASTQALPNGRYVALCLVGPGGTATLAVGTYTVWVKVIDNPEIPVENVYLLTID